MLAIEAGEAVVTGAAEIYSRGSEPIEVPGGTDVVLGWQQAGDGAAFQDAGRMGFAYLDADGDQIGATLWAPMINTAAGAWTPRSLADSSPVGAATLRLFMEIERRAFLAADQGFDAITLTIGGVAVTLTNPGAETGDTTGWTTPTYGPLVVTNSLFGAAPYAGSWFFTGGNNIYVSAQQDVSLSAVVPVDPVPPVAKLRIWGGRGPIVLSDGNTYAGIGDPSIAQQSSGAIGGFAQGLMFGLSGIEAKALELLDDAADVKGGSVVFRRLIFASDAQTLLDDSVWDRGRVDTITTEETIGRDAAVQMAVESAARGLGRSLARQRSDADQRLINPNDGYLKHAAYAGEKMLYWGGRKPSRTGDATGGSFGGINVSGALRSI